MLKCLTLFQYKGLDCKLYLDKLDTRNDFSVQWCGGMNETLLPIGSDICIPGFQLVAVWGDLAVALLEEICQWGRP